MNAKPFITWIVMFLTVDSGNSFPLAHHHHHHHHNRHHHSGKTEWQVNKQIWSVPLRCNNNNNNILTWIIFLQLPWQQCHLLITANRDIKSNYQFWHCVARYYGAVTSRAVTTRSSAIAERPHCTLFKLWQNISAKSVHLTVLYVTALTSTNHHFTVL